MFSPSLHAVMAWTVITVHWLIFIAWIDPKAPADCLACEILGGAVVLLPPILLFLASRAIGRTWKRFGEARWLKFPPHFRRGLVRLYLVAAVPWAVWYGYRIWLASASSRYRSFDLHRASDDFWHLYHHNPHAYHADGEANRDHRSDQIHVHETTPPNPQPKTVLTIMAMLRGSLPVHYFSKAYPQAVIVQL
jgi:hypothetical protein